MVVNENVALLLVATAAAILPSISRFLRLPGPVAEIIFGILLGKSLLQLQFGGDWLPFLAHLGFLMLMFQAGMEIDFAMIRNERKGRIFFHLLLFGATFGLSYYCSLYLGQGVFLALVLSTTSLGLVMPTLKELGLIKSSMGQSLLLAATLADFLTLLGITFYVLWHNYGLSWRFFYPLPLFLGFGILLWFIRLWAWWYPEKVERLFGPRDSQEIGVRLALALLFLFVALSELTHLEPVLGAFMGGCVISLVFRETGSLEDKLSALGFGFLIPIFFIYVGMSFDLSSLLGWDRIVFTIKLVGLALAVKIVPSLLLVFRGVKLGSTIKTGLLLSTRLSLIVAAASIGVKEGLIDSNMKDSIVLLAVITCLIGPTAFKALTRRRVRPDFGKQS